MTSTTSSQPDLNGILSQVKGLEAEKERLQKMVEEALKEKEQAKAEAMESNARATRLSESKRAEMKAALEGVIKQWLQDSVEDANVRQEFEQGMQRLVQNAQEESGVWKLVCCASNMHAKRLSEIESLREECNALKQRGTGEFKAEDSRKRSHPDAPDLSDVWGQFESAFKQGGMIK